MSIADTIVPWRPSGSPTMRSGTGEWYGGGDWPPATPDGHQTIALAWSTTPESRWGDNRGFEFRRSRLRTPSPPDGRAVDRLADGEMALASGALVVRGDDRVHERVRADRVGEDDN
jgi:hypothetical protein